MAAILNEETRFSILVKCVLVLFQSKFEKCTFIPFLIRFDQIQSKQKNKQQLWSIANV